MIIQITVIPRSGVQRCEYSSARLKCYLKQAPEQNKVNDELVFYIARRLKIPVENVEITQGRKQRKKLVRIKIDLAEEQIQALLFA